MGGSNVCNERSLKLGFKDYRDLTIKTCLESIPYIGSPISSAYFGYKEEIRFKRIEQFYEDLADRMDKIEENFNPISIDTYNKDEVISMIESLNDEIEKQSQQHKKTYFINYFIKYVDERNKTSNDDKLLFFEILKELNRLDIQALKIFHEDKSNLNIKSSNDNDRVIINKLSNYGLLNITGREDRESGTNSFYNRDYNDNLLYKVSLLGAEFCEFCLSDF